MTDATADNTPTITPPAKPNEPADSEDQKHRDLFHFARAGQLYCYIGEVADSFVNEVRKIKNAQARSELIGILRVLADDFAKHEVPDYDARAAEKVAAK